MRAAFLLLPLAAACAPAPGQQGGIVSTNPCADAILVRIAPERIAAISHYSQDAAAASIPLAVARRYRATAGTAEEVIALRPDLVVTDTFAPAASRAAYARAGLKVLTLDSPTTVAGSQAQVMQIADAVGEHARGRALVAGIDRALTAAAVPEQAPSRRAAVEGVAAGNVPAILYIGGDLANGSGTLLDEMLRRTGFRNAGADYGLAFTGTLPIETIAAHPPAVILSPGDGRTAALRRRVLARSGARTVEAAFPHDLINCGGPTIIAAAMRLAAIRRRWP